MSLIGSIDLREHSNDRTEIALLRSEHSAKNSSVLQLAVYGEH